MSCYRHAAGNDPQRNHYHVKLLKGYDVSINLKDNRIYLKGGRDRFTGERESEELFVTQIPYERIVISGKGSPSTEADKLLTYHNINIVLRDTYGNLVTAMHKVSLAPLPPTTGSHSMTHSVNLKRSQNCKSNFEEETVKADSILALSRRVEGNNFDNNLRILP